MYPRARALKALIPRAPVTRTRIHTHERASYAKEQKTSFEIRAKRAPRGRRSNYSDRRGARLFNYKCTRGERMNLPGQRGRDSLRRLPDFMTAKGVSVYACVSVYTRPREPIERGEMKKEASQGSSGRSDRAMMTFRLRTEREVEEAR